MRIVNVPMRIDLPLLIKQKEVLVSLLAVHVLSPDTSQALEGILSLLDHVQDTVEATEHISKEGLFNGGINQA